MHRKNPRLVLWAVALGLTAALAVVLLVRTLRFVPLTQAEMRRTPTPTPIFGNVMVVTPDPDAPTAPPVLKNGAEGEEVTRLQSRLKTLGYYEGEIDGQFGPGTRGAVTAFQEANGLDADGVVGPETSALLYSAGAKPAALSTPTPTPEPTPSPTPVPAARRPYVREDGLPLLVNKTHLLPDDYRPYDMVTMNSYCPASVVKIKYSDTQAEREAVDALLVMLRAAIADGVDNWQISAAYRSRRYQQQLFDKQVNTYIQQGMSRSKATSAARKLVADPGSSEHHLGTCFDITVPGKSFRGTRQHKWLAEHCWEYGFILRYTEEKKQITGFSAEAWHYRWVGVEHARIMRDENLCLEEYIERYGVDFD